MLMNKAVIITSLNTKIKLSLTINMKPVPKWVSCETEEKANKIMVSNEKYR